ncbi:MAG: exodeoxyribonuclease VII large subunit [Alphaproteobacteria bacterium]|nr:exodeoxyribonuclease VII large subunit [Alphaproteobacteria bacterium]
MLPTTSPATAGNLPEYSVGELSSKLKRTVEEAFGLVRVRGEISGFKRAASGHLYLTLKDTEANLDAVCWKGQAARLGFRPEDGLEVVCTGRLTTYPSRSRYQLVIERMEPAGTGALMALLEERRRRLAAEGLFDQARKRPLPYLPEVIGVVTSPTGAVIRDILHRLRERFPRRVLLWPVLVQGEGAAEQVAAAIAGFNRLPTDGAVPRPDLLIVARGGGSIEDLWAFNEEIVVRAAAASAIPLISAVGHETDTTLIDFASDRRAPTPTAAAEMAVPVRAELLGSLLEREQRLVGAFLRETARRRERLAALARALPEPRRLLEQASQRLDDLAGNLRRALEIGLGRRRERYAAVAGRIRGTPLRRLVEREQRDLARLALRLGQAVGRGLDQRAERLRAAASLLASYSYRGVLERGFALVRDAEGRPLRSAAAARQAEAVEIEFHDGRVGYVAAGRPGATRPGGGRGHGSDGQGSLF